MIGAHTGPWLRFTTLRSRLFAAFVGVLILSLILTGVIFWLQIRLLNTQRVVTDLQDAAPLARTYVDRDLIRYWQATLAEQAQGTLQDQLSQKKDDLARLKSSLTRDARTLGVRVLLIDYCNNIAIDTASPAALHVISGRQVPSTCSQVLDDVTGSAQPQSVSLGTGIDAGQARQVQQTTLPGTGSTFYLAFPSPLSSPYTQGVPYTPGGSSPLLVSTIIIAKSTSSIDQNTLTSVVPRLFAAGSFALALTLLVVALIVRAIIRPLRTITAASERMAQGDYDQRVPEAGEDEVGQLAHSFNRMATEVSNAREHQRQFIANISHDLKTPLTSIVGFSQILVEGDGMAASPMQRRAAQVINEEAGRLQRLTLDLLDLSRLEAGQLRMRFSKCDLYALAGQALLRYAELPANAALTFLDQRAPGPLIVNGDADRLMQVLVNLLDNAVKFCDPRGSVALTTMCRDERAILVVANTGVGIAQEDLTRVFQRFYRTDHSRATRTGGSGLGLAIVREIVAAHAGTVEAHSSPDGWTRFIVTLPIAKAHRTVDRLSRLGDTEPDTASAP